MKFAHWLRLMVGIGVVGSLGAVIDARGQVKPAPTVNPARGQQVASQICARATASTVIRQRRQTRGWRNSIPNIYTSNCLITPSGRGQQRPARENAS